MANETFESQAKDAEMIFTAIRSFNFDNYAMAVRAVATIYIPDMTISRAGISYALKRLEKFYENNPT